MVWPFLGGWRLQETWYFKRLRYLGRQRLWGEVLMDDVFRETLPF